MQAYKRHLFGPQYVWATYSWYRERWWTQEVTNTTISCTDEELEEFVIRERMLTLSHYAIPENRNKITDQGTVSIYHRIHFKDNECYNFYLHTGLQP